MILWFYTFILSLSAFAFSAAGSWVMRAVGTTLMAPRTPNTRDNHTAPVPKGGGLAIMIAVISFLLVAGVNAAIIWAILVLTIISFIDDCGSMSALWRLITHIVSAYIIVSALDVRLLDEWMVAPAESALWVIVLVWGMNLYNFMDGIDGITSVQTMMICFGIITMTLLVPALPNAFAYDSIIIVSAVLGFWYFNRHPATLFMGDSGSIPLGALMGWLLLSLAAEGYAHAALILPSYYLVDSGLTLLIRVVTLQKIWRAHSSHAYQRFVRGNRSHNTALLWIMLHNVAMLALIYVTIMFPTYAWQAVWLAYGSALLLYSVFMLWPPKRITTEQDVIPPVHAIS